MGAEKRCRKTIDERKISVRGEASLGLPLLRGCGLILQHLHRTRGWMPPCSAWGWHRLGRVVSFCTAPRGHIGDSPNPGIKRRALSSYPRLTAPGCGVSTPCSAPWARRCRGSRCFCLCNPNIATSVPKIVLQHFTSHLSFHRGSLRNAVPIFLPKPADPSGCRAPIRLL